MNEEITIVECLGCGSHRSSRWAECFCHETRSKPVPESFFNDWFVKKALQKDLLNERS